VLTDATGRHHGLHGEVISANHLPAWLNVDTWIRLARWEYDGQVCHGDLQQMQWHDYVHQFLRPRRPATFRPQ